MVFRVSISVVSCQLLGTGQLTKISPFLVSDRTFPELGESFETIGQYVF